MWTLRQINQHNRPHTLSLCPWCKLPTDIFIFIRFPKLSAVALKKWWIMWFLSFSVPDCLVLSRGDSLCLVRRSGGHANTPSHRSDVTDQKVKIIAQLNQPAFGHLILPLIVNVSLMYNGNPLVRPEKWPFKRDDLSSGIEINILISDLQCQVAFSEGLASP